MLGRVSKWFKGFGCLGGGVILGFRVYGFFGCRDLGIRDCRDFRDSRVFRDFRDFRDLKDFRDFRFSRLGILGFRV